MINQTKKKVNPVKKVLLITSGFICVFLGVIGIFLPLMPTTPFLLLAAACFIRSSDKFYNKLITNRFLGKYVRDYREKKGMHPRMKVSSIVLLWITMLYSIIFVVDNIWVRLLLLSIALIVSRHIYKLKSTD